MEIENESAAAKSRSCLTFNSEEVRHANLISGNFANADHFSISLFIF